MNKLPKYQRVLVFIGILFIAILTGILSWGHGHAHALYLGETALAAVLLPLVPDVSMLISIFIRKVNPANGWAKLGMWIGIAVTIWMNLSNIHVYPGQVGRTIQSGVLSLIAPTFLFLCIEMAFSIGRTAEVAKEAKAEVEVAKAAEVAQSTEDAEKARRREIAAKGWEKRRADAAAAATTGTKSKS